MIHNLLQFNFYPLPCPIKLALSILAPLIPYGSRIALIGQNGAGKSSLLNIIQGKLEPSEGKVTLPEDVVFGFVPQIVDNFSTLSGGQRFQKALSQALENNPNFLILDEPTNHLDRDNKKALLKFIKAFRGTILVVTHDVELLEQGFDVLWHIEPGSTKNLTQSYGAKIHIFNGSYNDYVREKEIKHNQMEEKLKNITKEKKETHLTLMKEQERAKKSDMRGKNRFYNANGPTIVSDEKARRAIQTSGKKKKKLRDEKEDLLEQLSHLKMPETINPSFLLQAESKQKQNLHYNRRW